LLIRIGAWLLLLSALLGPIFYWPDLGRAARVAGAAIPVAVMGVLTVWWLWRGKQRSAVACIGSFLLMFFVLLAILLAEYRWFQYMQPPEWELWGKLASAHEEIAPPIAADILDRSALEGRMDNLADAEEQEESENAASRPLDVLSRVPRYLNQRRHFILSNTQIAGGMLIMALSIAFFLWTLRATFLACWLTMACVALFTAGLLLVGLKEQLLFDHVALAACHYLAFSAALFILGVGFERAAADRVAHPFYGWAVVLCTVSALGMACFGVHEWLGEPWEYANERLNLWLLAYSVPSLALAWLGERFGTESQRRWTRLFYLLVPVFLLWPLSILFSARGPVLGTLGRAPFHLYELLYLLASIVLLAMGRWRHMSLFLWAGLGGLAIFVFRVTFRHMRDELIWPTCIAALGFILVALGIWRAYRAEPEYPAGPKRLPMPATSSVYTVATVALPES
jgi:hypothetical protein